MDFYEGKWDVWCETHQRWVGKPRDSYEEAAEYFHETYANYDCYGEPRKVN